MTPTMAVEWLAYAARRPVEEIGPLVASLPSGDLVRLGRFLEKSPLLNPPKNAARVKVHRAMCMCGCGQVFEREYRTCRPKYVNDRHRAHANYRRQVAKGNR